MKALKGKDDGFTLIELLIVIAILGVLAAVIIPNVGRFIGSGKTEAQNTEFQTIQTSVQSMMADNGIGTIPNPVSGDAQRTQSMTLFPDSTSADGAGGRATGKTRDVDDTLYVYTGGTPDQDGYVLYDHDRLGADGAVSLTKYVALATADSWYTVQADGTVKQFDVDGNQTNP